MGACQIGSVLIQYLCSLCREIKHVSFFWDSFAGQNHNQYITAALANVVKMCHFKTVSTNFLEPVIRRWNVTPYILLLSVKRRIQIRTIMIRKGRENLIYYNAAGVNKKLKKFNINGKSSNFSSSFPTLSKLYRERLPIS